jgi:hypothetical protein
MGDSAVSFGIAVNICAVGCLTDLVLRTHSATSSQHNIFLLLAFLLLKEPTVRMQLPQAPHN